MTGPVKGFHVFIIIIIIIHIIIIIGELWLARKNNCLLSRIFPEGEGGFGQMMHRSPEKSPQDSRDGFFLYSAQASFSWLR